MAGEFASVVQLTQGIVDELYGCGLELQIKLDCSHNINVWTVRPDRTTDPVMPKPIELDTSLRIFGPNTTPAAAAAQMAVASAPVQTLLGELHNIAGGFPAALTARAIKIEFPSFDDTIVDLAEPPPALVNAVTACRAATIVAFNALSAKIRSSMGMFDRRDAYSFSISEPEKSPRTAVAH
jgi:hypothetical protein